jgi:DNA polymerase/3'-5' exonuclease PolX
MPKDLNSRLIKIFQTLYDFHSTLGSRGNIATKYRVASYAKILKYLTKTDRPIYGSEDLRGIPSIGKSTLEKVDQIAATGTHPLYEEVIHDPKYKVLTLFQTVRGIGPARAYAFYKEGHRTIRDLQSVDFSASDPNLAASLQYYDELSRRIPRKEITQFTQYLSKILPKSIELVNSGSYRMEKRDSGDIDLLAVCQNPAKDQTTILRALEENGIIVHLYNKSKKKINGIVRFRDRIYQMDMLFISREELPWYLLYFGSGKEFSKRIRTIAIQQGYKLNEKGLYKKGKRVPFHPKEEKEIFDFLKTPYVKPEDR